MSFNNILQNIIETRIVNEEQFSDSELKLFSDFLSDKNAVEIVDGLLKKADNNVQKALDALNIMADNVPDSFINKDEVEKAKQNLLSISNKPISVKESPAPKNKDIITNKVQIIQALIDHDINPGFFDKFKGAQACIYINGSNNPYKIAAISKKDNSTQVYLIPIWEKAFVEKRPGTLIKDIKELHDIINDKDNIRMRKSKEYIEHYYSDADEAKHKIEDLKTIKKSLIDFSVNSIVSKIVEKYRSSALNEDQIKEILNITRERESNIDKANKKMNLGIAGGTSAAIVNSKTNIPEEQIKTFFDSLTSDGYCTKSSDNAVFFNWLKQSADYARQVYDSYEGTNNLTGLLSLLNIKSHYLPYNYYWEQLIRTVGSNMTPFIAKRFMPYDKKASNANKIIDDVIKPKGNSQEYTVNKNYTVHLLLFFEKYKQDLLELYLIQNNKSKTYLEDLDIYEKLFTQQDAQNMTIIDPRFLQYKLIAEERYNEINKQVDIEFSPTDRYVAYNFVSFQNDYRFKEDFDLIEEQRDFVTLDDNKQILSSDSMDISFDESINDFVNKNILGNLKLTASKKAIEAIKNNIKTETMNKYNIDVANNAENVQYPELFDRITNAVQMAIKEEKEEKDKEKYFKLLTSFLAAYGNAAVNQYIKYAEQRETSELLNDVLSSSDLLDVLGNGAKLQQYVSENSFIEYQDGKYQLINVLNDLNVGKKPTVSYLCQRWNKDNESNGYYLDYKGIKTLDDLTIDRLRTADDNVDKEQIFYDAKNDIIKQYKNSAANDYTKEHAVTPTFILQCINDNQNYNQAMSIGFSEIQNFIKNQSIYNFKIFNNPIANVLKKINPSSKELINKGIIEVTATRLLYLILEAINKYINSEKPTIPDKILGSMMGALPVQIGASPDQLYRIKSLKYDGSIVKFDYSEDGESINISMQDGATLQNLLYDAIELKMMLYSDLLGKDDSKVNRKAVKTPTQKITLGKLIECIQRYYSTDDPQKQEEYLERFNKDLEYYNVITSSSKKALDERQKKLQLLSELGIFNEGKDNNLDQIDDERLKNLIKMLPQDVIDELSALNVTYQETNQVWSNSNIENSIPVVYTPDSAQLSRWRGQNLKHSHHSTYNPENRHYGFK